MASKGLGKGRHKKGKKGTNNLPAGQYTPSSPPPITTNLQQATTNILPPPRANISLLNEFSCPHRPTSSSPLLLIIVCIVALHLYLQHHPHLAFLD